MIRKEVPPNKTGDTHSYRQRYPVFLTPEQGQAAKAVFWKNHPRFAPVFFRKTLHRLNTHLYSLWTENLQLPHFSIN